MEWHPAKFASQNTSILLSNWVHGYLQVIRGYLIVYRATLLRAVRSCVRGEAIFRINFFTEYKRSGLSMARKLNLAATPWNSFKSSPVRRSSSSLTSSRGSCHFAVPRNSLIGPALGGQSHSLEGARNVLLVCVSVFYTKKLIVRACDHSGPRVTTLLNSYTPRNKFSARFRPSRRPTMKKSSPCTRLYVCKPLWKKWHGEATPRENPSAPKT